MMLPPMPALMLLVFATIVPLSGDDRAVVETARDGRDHREEAFFALVENARRWTEGFGDVPIRLEVDVDAVTGRPDAARGALYRLAGVIQQRAALEPPYDVAREWFIRDDAGRPLLVYVVGVSAADEAARFADGTRVSLPARFYKRVDDTARDGRRRAYAAFVGALPTVEGAAAATEALSAPVVVLMTVVPLLGLVTLGLVLVVRRRRRGAEPGPVRSFRHGPDDEPLDDGAGLPDDPAAALSELHRRAETPSPRPRA